MQPDSRPGMNRYIKRALCLFVIAVLSAFCYVAWVGFLADVYYGGFPSREEVKNLLGSYENLRKDDPELDQLKTLLWRMRAPQTDPHESIACFALRELAGVYLRTHDEQILNVADEAFDNSLGYFADAMCFIFYDAVHADLMYREHVARSDDARVVYMDCVRLGEITGVAQDSPDGGIPDVVVSVKGRDVR